MPPTLLLLRVGRWCRLALPLPLFLLWPLLAVAWFVLGLVWLLSGRPASGSSTSGLQLLRMFGQLRGTEVDLRGEDHLIYMRFV